MKELFHCKCFISIPWTLLQIFGAGKSALCLSAGSQWNILFKFLCNAHGVPGANVCKIIAISFAERMEFRFGWGTALEVQLRLLRAFAPYYKDKYLSLVTCMCCKSWKKWQTPSDCACAVDWAVAYSWLWLWGTSDLKLVEIFNKVICSFHGRQDKAINFYSYLLGTIGCMYRFFLTEWVGHASSLQS